MSDRLIRGAQGMVDYINSLIISGDKISRPAVYRLIEGGSLNVTRLSDGGEIWITETALRQAFGLPHIHRDSDSVPQGENSRSEVEGEATQSGRSDSEGIAQPNPGVLP
jgi:hypothetical protein